MKDLAPWQRAPLLILGFVGLVLGILAGLARLAWPVPGIALGPPHGVLMLCAFFGTLISLERAVALGRLWAYLAPLAGGVGGLLVVGGHQGLGGIAFVVTGIVLVLASLAAQRLQPALHARVLTLGAACWLVGVAVWLGTGAIALAQWWWIAFLVITIAGERLELSRLVQVSPAMTRLFLAIMATLVAACLLTLVAGNLGLRLYGASLAALAIWLLRQDVARRTVRGKGLTRYIAAALLGGYLWLAVAGAVLAVLAPSPGEPGWDTGLHGIVLGFVFAMVFGHAPIILPAVLRVKLPYQPGLYVPLALLHLSLMLRVAGDFGGQFPWRAWGGMGSALAIALFLVMQVTAIAVANRPQRQAANSRGT